MREPAGARSTAAWIDSPGWTANVAAAATEARRRGVGAPAARRDMRRWRSARVAGPGDLACAERQAQHAAVEALGEHHMPQCFDCQPPRARGRPLLAERGARTAELLGEVLELRQPVAHREHLLAVVHVQ